MFTSPFFRRLFLPYLVLICAVVTLLGLVGARGLRASFLDRTAHGLANQAALISAGVEDDLRHGRTDDLRARARDVASRTQVRVTIIRDDGLVLADTEADPDQMENHRLRPEVVDARTGTEGVSVRHSATLDIDLLYYARRLVVDGQTYYLRMAVHLEALDRQLTSLYELLAVAGGLLMAAAGGICYVFARRHAAPLLELNEFAAALAHGQLNRRLLGKNTGEMATLAASLNLMADSLSALLAQSNQGKAELLTILASLSDGVIATDAQQRILLVNQTAARLLGFEEDQARGRPLWEVVRHAPVLQTAQEVLTTGAARVFALPASAGRHVEVTISTFPPAEASPTAPVGGLVVVAHDTTQAVQYQELRKEFVANVSHELRTPLSIIKGFAETLREGAMADPEKGPEYLRIVEQHVDQLTNLVNDLLEPPAWRAGGRGRRVPVNVGAVARRVGHMLLPAAQRKRQALSINVPEQLPRVAGDPNYLERALVNLIDNAVKYTPDGGRISLVARAQGAEVLLEVTDNGIGIPAADLPRIFERFYRVDRSRSRQMGGTGLGLSIVKHVAQSHAGKIEVSSTIGVGSTFVLRLPAMGTPAAEGQAAS